MKPLAAGDDRTDEDLFAQMPPGEWTIHVGMGQTTAANAVRDPQSLRSLLSMLARAAAKFCGPP